LHAVGMGNMKHAVHILSTIRNPKLWHSSVLVFKTLRVGFPTADIFVWGNGLDEQSERLVANAAGSVKAHFRNIPRIEHGHWIETCVANNNTPFWICDTDIVFFGSMEKFKWKADTQFAGRYEREFFEEWSKTRKVARLHPSLMYFNPAKLRIAICGYPGLPAYFSTVSRELFHWSFVPVRIGEGCKSKRGILFYDACAGLHHALGGTSFTEEQNLCFEHCHCGTYANEIAAAVPHLQGLPDLHRAIFMQPELARGLRAQQDKYYEQQSAARQRVKPSSNGHASKAKVRRMAKEFLPTRKET
jgi:hypothetical protein